MTLAEIYLDLANSMCWSWIADWWPPGGPSSLIVQTAEGTRDTKSPDIVCPPNVQSLGWGGSDINGRLVWVAWDLDVGHGAKQYGSTDLALADAFRIRDFLRGQAEIRLSKSGIGVHVRHRLPNGSDRPASDGPQIAKAVAQELDLKADPSALGRQAFWFWTASPAPNAFKLIWHHEGVEK